MTVAKITTPGLAAMGICVAMLWSCLIGERVLTQRAAREQARILHEIHLLRQRQSEQPVDVPLPHGRRHSRPVQG